MKLVQARLSARNDRESSFHRCGGPVKNTQARLGSSKQTLGGEWSHPFCSRPRVGSSKGPKPVVMRGLERVLS